MGKLKGVISEPYQKLSGSLNQSQQRVEGSLNIYTMLTGDGREIELAFLNDVICWRRVNDVEWVPLVSVSDLRGYSPIKGLDYWTESDKREILDYVESNVLEDIEYPISSIIGLDEKLESIIEDKSYIHKQSSSVSSWDIHHTLGKYPSVTVVDSAGSTVVGEVTYIDLNHITVKFSSPFSGKAYLS